MNTARISDFNQFSMVLDTFLPPPFIGTSNNFGLVFADEYYIEKTIVHLLQKETKEKDLSQSYCHIIINFIFTCAIFISLSLIFLYKFSSKSS